MATDLFDLAVHHHQNGNLAQAAALYHKALQTNPNLLDAHYNLGIILQNQGQLAEAMACYRQVLRLSPNHADAHNNLGVAFKNQGLLAEAIECYQQSLRINRTHAGAYNNLGTALFKQGRREEALSAYRQALRLRPSFAEAHNNLGNVLFAQGRFSEALASFGDALRLQPNYAEAHYNAGNAHFSQARPDEATCAFQEALRLKPNYAEAHNNLGNVYRDQGRLDDAIACYQTARNLEPHNTAWHSNQLFTLIYQLAYDAHALLEEHRRWEQQHAPPPPALGAGQCARRWSPDPAARLRVGYVSPDFREHVVGRNIWPLLRHHDHREFEVFLYSNVTKPDALTDQFRAAADHWHDIVAMSDDQATDQIRADKIDILVDLALHMAGNRLSVFARKPAPLQVTFAGYPGTTGLSSINYRLTDSTLDPPGLYDDCYAEASYRLPHSFWCYHPRTEEPPVAPLPALTKGFVTFGCLNNFCKINDEVLKHWAQVLAAVHESRLLLLTDPGSHRQRTLDFLAGQGIAVHRVAFSPRLPTPEYLALYNQVDIGLDTFPYNGHTTSLDSYWMGVPVITLVGPTVVGRAGLSQLTNLGLAELAAATPDSFIRKAVELGGDLPRLQILRTGLRNRLRQSPLMDAQAFTRDIENAYRVMWCKWHGQI